MFGLPIVAAALALMGAPSLPSSCDPGTVAAYNAAALTYFTPGTTTPLRVEYGGQVCGGLLYLSASPAERLALHRLNPGWNLTRAAGVALVAVLHESRHATGDRNEASAECHAMRELDAFAARYAPADERAAIVAAGRSYDAGMPAAYHEAGC